LYYITCQPLRRVGHRRWGECNVLKTLTDWHSRGMTLLVLR